MQIFKGPHQLVNEELNVIDLQVLLGPNHPVQISLHQVTHQVQLADCAPFPGNVDYVLETEYVLMHAVLHDHDFSEHALSINLQVLSKIFYDIFDVGQTFNSALLSCLCVGC